MSECIIIVIDEAKIISFCIGIILGLIAFLAGFEIYKWLRENGWF